MFNSFKSSSKLYRSLKFRSLFSSFFVFCDYFYVIYSFSIFDPNEFPENFKFDYYLLLQFPK